MDMSINQWYWNVGIQSNATHKRPSRYRKRKKLYHVTFRNWNLFCRKLIVLFNLRRKQFSVSNFSIFRSTYSHALFSHNWKILNFNFSQGHHIFHSDSALAHFGQFSTFWSKLKKLPTNTMLYFIVIMWLRNIC